MDRIRGDFGQRHEDETAQVHGRMRNCKFWSFDYEIAIENDIQIDHAGALDLRTEAAHFPFDGENDCEQLGRLQFCF